jgi:dihydropteroate synthase
LDPGIGFGKTFEHNIEILNGLDKFGQFNLPILIGTSRKSFIGKILNTEPENRLYGTIASVVLCIAKGANIVRVHDVKEVKDAVLVADAILKNNNFEKVAEK